DSRHHRLGTTTVDETPVAAAGKKFREQVGNEPRPAVGAVIRAKMQLEPRLLKVLDPGQVTRRASTVTETDSRNRRSDPSDLAVGLETPLFPAEGEKGSVPDSSGHEN